jgi:hypothetical protein
MSTTPTALFTLFSTFGPIDSVRILSHKNCAFVNFTTQDDAISAKKSLQSKEIMGPGTGPVRIGFAKAPSSKPAGKTQLVQQHKDDGSDLLDGGMDNLFVPGSLANGVTYLDSNTTSASNTNCNSVSNSTSNSPYLNAAPTMSTSNLRPPSLFFGNANGGTTPDSTTDPHLVHYMMNEMIGDNPVNMIAAVAAERQFIMKELGEDESDGVLFDGKTSLSLSLSPFLVFICLTYCFALLYNLGFHMALTYYPTISSAPELGQQRNVDISRLRDIRKKLDNGNHISLQEVESIAMECMGSLVELCSGKWYKRSNRTGNLTVCAVF